MSNLDNSKLKELMHIDPGDMTDKDRGDLFDELKNANLLVPVNFTSQPSFNTDNLEDGQAVTLDAPLSFEIIKIERNGLNVLPLFTDIDASSQLGNINVIGFPVKDIADLIIEDGNIDEVVINPNTEYSIGLNVQAFLLNCLDDNLKNLFDIEEDLKKYSIPLEHDTVLFLRSETPFMFEEAEDGIFSTDVPFGASMDDVCNVNFKYLNKLYIPKGTMFLYLSNIVEDVTKEPDVFLAPKLKFQLINQDENTFEWLCIEQDVE